MTLPPDDPTRSYLPETVSFTPGTNPGPDPRTPPGYEILAELGRGGMGVVYLARDAALNRHVALKMILSGDHASESERARFLREAQAVAQLRHPGIVQVYAVGEHDGRPFMALEFCEGGSLDRRLRDRPPTPREAAEMVRSLADAVHAAHDAGIVHRDLKPANVLIAVASTPERIDQLKVADFGLARRLDEDGGTRTGAVVGTPAYMPPEQARGEQDLGPSVDIYALGAVLYAALTGRPPFRGATPAETIHQVLTDDPVPVRRLNPAVPRDLETVCLKCLHKDPARRYPSAKSLAEDLGRVLAGEPVLARPVGPVERAAKWVRRNPAVAALTAVVALVLAAGVTASWVLAAWALNEASRAEGKARDEARQAGIARQKTTEAADLLRQANDQLARTEVALYAGQLGRAATEFQAGNGPRGFEILGDCQWDLRRVEFRHLWTRYSSRQTLLHEDFVTEVCYSPDGGRIAFGSEDRSVRVRDAVTGREVIVLAGHRQPVTGVCYSPDGGRIASVGADGAVKVWNAATGREVATLTVHRAGAAGVAFSPDGTRLAAGGSDATVRVWAGADAVLTLRGHRRRVTGVCFSPDGRRLASASADGTVKVWDAATGERLHSLDGHDRGATGVSFSPDGRRLVSASVGGAVRLWDVETGRVAKDLTGLTSEFPRVCFSPDGAYVAGGGEANRYGEVRVWDAQTSREVLAFRGHGGAVTGVCFSPDGRRLASAGGITVKVWDAVRGHDVLALRGHAGRVNAVAISPDGQRVASGGQDRFVRVWEATTGREVLSLQGHALPISAVAFSPDGGRIASCGGRVNKPGEVKLWNAVTGREVLALAGLPRPVSSVAFSPDGRRLVTGGFDNVVRVWDAVDGRELHVLRGHTAFVGEVAFHPDGQRVASAGGDKTVKVWLDGKVVRTLVGHDHALNGVCFSPDGRSLASWGGEEYHPGELRLWSVEDGRELAALKGHTGEVFAASFSPDGKRILSAGRDGVVKVWDVATGQELLSLAGHAGGATAVAISPDGWRFVSGGEDAIVRVWEAGESPDLRPLTGHAGVVTGVCFSPDGHRLASVGTDRTVRVWDPVKGRELLTCRGHAAAVMDVAFDSDGGRVFGWNSFGGVLAWSATTGEPTDPTDPPTRPRPQSGQVPSPDGVLHAEPHGNRVAVRDTRTAAPHAWPLPDAVERKRHHAVRAAAAEKEEKWFAVAYHVGRLLLDEPDDADLKHRRDEALRKHAAKPDR